MQSSRPTQPSENSGRAHRCQGGSLEAGHSPHPGVRPMGGATHESISQKLERATKTLPPPVVCLAALTNPTYGAS
eukprot:3017134-Amphidinium_carterae.1